MIHDKTNEMHIREGQKKTAEFRRSAEKGFYVFIVEALSFGTK